jgi:ketosteroid isomerase-like protein
MKTVTTLKTLNPEMVKAEVERFWDILRSKRGEALASLYAPECSVFGSTSRRPEPGRLAAARRSREYCGPKTETRVETGLIDIVMLSPTAAAASYNFQLHASKVAHEGREEEHVVDGRCSQVFAIDEQGDLKIFHEHMSVTA